MNSLRKIKLPSDPTSVTEIAKLITRLHGTLDIKWTVQFLDN